MSRCCIIDENNKMIPLSEQEMKNILKNGTTYNGDNIDITYACIDTPSSKGYLTEKK